MFDLEIFSSNTNFNLIIYYALYIQSQTRLRAFIPATVNLNDVTNTVSYIYRTHMSLRSWTAVAAYKRAQKRGCRTK